MISSSATRPALKAGVAFLLLLVPCRLRGQVEVSAAVELATHDVWRGITWSGTGIARPGLSVAVGPGRHAIATGLWSTIELGRGRAGALRLQSAEGSALVQHDWWLEGSSQLSAIDVRLGVVTYRYRTDSLRVTASAASHTTEVYGRLNLFRLPLSPRLSIYRDIGRVRGAAVEAALMQPLPVLPPPLSINLDLGVTAGFSIDQRGGQRAYAAGNGLTFLDVSLGVGRRIGPIDVGATLHSQFNRDEVTRRRSGPAAPGSRTSLVWFSAGVSWNYVVIQ